MPSANEQSTNGCSPPYCHATFHCHGHECTQFYIEEGRKHVDYLGYVRPRHGRDDADDEDRLISVQFSWKGEEKNVSTFFVGEPG